MNVVEPGQLYEYLGGTATIKEGARDRANTPYPPLGFGGMMPEEVPAQHRPPSRAGKTYMHGAAAHMPPFMMGMGMGMGPRAPEYNRSPGVWLPASSAPLPMQVGLPAGPYDYMYHQDQPALPHHFPVPGRQLSQLPGQQPQLLQPPPQQPQYLWYPYPMLPSPQAGPSFQCPTCRCHAPLPHDPHPQPYPLLVPAPATALPDHGSGSISTDPIPVPPRRAEEKAGGASGGSEVSRKKSICKVPGCGKLNKGGGLCKHHGGGRRCAAEGCDRSSRGAEGLCIKHGGGPRCLYPSCLSSARNSGGFCKKHGGGRRCVMAECTKYSMPSSDMCSTHAGLPTPQSDSSVAEGGAMEDFLTMPVGPSSPPSTFYPTLDPLPRLPTGLFPPLLWDDEVAPQGQADLFPGSAPTTTTPGLIQPSAGGTNTHTGASSNTTRLTVA